MRYPNNPAKDYRPLKLDAGKNKQIYLYLDSCAARIRGFISEHCLDFGPGPPDW
jgi:hypothetical protein